MDWVINLINRVLAGLELLNYIFPHFIKGIQLDATCSVRVSNPQKPARILFLNS